MSRRNNIGKVRRRLTAIGDKAATKFEKTDDLNSGNLAIRAFGGAINAARVQIQYKKLTGTPEKIDFLEDES